MSIGGVGRIAADLPSQEFRLESPRPLRGRVVDAEGKPVSGAVVKLNRFGGTRHWTWKGETDAAGRFEWPDGPAAGEVEFDASRPPFTRAVGRKFAAGSNGAMITLHRPLRLRGTVIDEATGKSIEKFTLIPGWGPDRPGGRVAWRRDGSARKLTGGAYDEVGLFPDQGQTRSLRVEAEGYAPGVLVGFNDDAGEIAHDFRLRRASGLSGVVRGPDGRPLAGAVVALTTSSFRPQIPGGKIDDFTRALAITTETGPDGRYEFWPQDEPSRPPWGKRWGGNEGGPPATRGFDRPNPEADSSPREAFEWTPTAAKPG